MMMVDSATVRLRASSRSTGILAMGQTARKAARDASSPRSTMMGSNGMRFSYKAMSALWQKDASGWK
jgi:hypothetical protein